MSFEETPEALERSIRVTDIPEGFDRSKIIESLQNAGPIQNVKHGKTDLIITFNDPDAREVSKIYNDCPVTDTYSSKIEDANTWDVIPEDISTTFSSPAKETPHEVSSTQSKVEPDFGFHYDKPHEIKTETIPEPKLEQNISNSTPVKYEEKIAEPSPIKEETQVKEEIPVKAPVEIQEPSPFKEVINVEREIIPESKPTKEMPKPSLPKTQEPEVINQSRSQTQVSGDSIRNLEEAKIILDRVNLPTREQLTQDDQFSKIWRGKYALIALTSWAVFYFVTSIF